MVTELALLHIYFINVRETEWAINTGQSRETGNIGYTKTKNPKETTAKYVLDTTIHKAKTSTTQYLYF